MATGSSSGRGSPRGRDRIAPPKSTTRESPEGREELWPDELLDGAGEPRNLVLHHLGVEPQKQMADADDEERDNRRNENEYECGSQERPRQPTHPAVPPRCVPRRSAGCVGSSPTLGIIGAALPRWTPCVSGAPA